MRIAWQLASQSNYRSLSAETIVRDTGIDQSFELEPGRVGLLMDNRCYPYGVPPSP